MRLGTALKELRLKANKSTQDFYFPYINMHEDSDWMDLLNDLYKMEECMTRCMEIGTILTILQWNGYQQNSKEFNTILATYVFEAVPLNLKLDYDKLYKKLQESFND